LLPFPANALSRFEPLCADVPHPTITASVADRNTPEQRLLAEDVHHIALPSVVEGIGHFLGVLFVKVVLIAISLSLSFQ
jgi:hypothetical protein